MVQIFMWSICMQIYTLKQCVHENRGNTSNHGTLLPHAWVVRCSLVGISQGVLLSFKAEWEICTELCQSSILPVTMVSPHPTQGRLQERAHKRKLLRCEWMWTWMEGKPQQRSMKERMTGDKQGWGERKGGEGGWTTRKQKADRWLLQREWKKRDGGQKKGCASALIFHTGQFLHTWREASDSKLSCPPPSFCHWLYLVPATSRCGWEWKAKMWIFVWTQHGNGEYISRVSANC